MNKKNIFIAFLLLFVLQVITVYADNQTNAPVTVEAYTAFLNAVAPSDSHHLYDEKMASNPAGASIVRSGLPGNYSYDFSKGENGAVVFITPLSAMRYCNWKQNASSSVDPEKLTEQGVYELSGDQLLSINPAATAFVLMNEGTSVTTEACINIDFSLGSSYLSFDFNNSSVGGVVTQKSSGCFQSIKNALAFLLFCGAAGEAARNGGDDEGVAPTEGPGSGIVERNIPNQTVKEPSSLERFRAIVEDSKSGKIDPHTPLTLLPERKLVGITLSGPEIVTAHFDTVRPPSSDIICEFEKTLGVYSTYFSSSDRNEAYSSGLTPDMIYKTFEHITAANENIRTFIEQIWPHFLSQNHFSEEQVRHTQALLDRIAPIEDRFLLPEQQAIGSLPRTGILTANELGQAFERSLTSPSSKASYYSSSSNELDRHLLPFVEAAKALLMQRSIEPQLDSSTGSSSFASSSTSSRASSQTVDPTVLKIKNDAIEATMTLASYRIEALNERAKENHSKWNQICSLQEDVLRDLEAAHQAQGKLSAYQRRYQSGEETKLADYKTILENKVVVLQKNVVKWTEEAVEEQKAYILTRVEATKPVVPTQPSWFESLISSFMKKASSVCSSDSSDYSYNNRRRAFNLNAKQKDLLIAASYEAAVEDAVAALANSSESKEIQALRFQIISNQERLAQFQEAKDFYGPLDSRIRISCRQDIIAFQQNQLRALLAGKSKEAEAWTKAIEAKEVALTMYNKSQITKKEAPSSTSMSDSSTARNNYQDYLQDYYQQSTLSYYYKELATLFNKISTPHQTILAAWEQVIKDQAKAVERAYQLVSLTNDEVTKIKIREVLKKQQTLVSIAKTIVDLQTSVINNDEENAKHVAQIELRRANEITELEQQLALRKEERLAFLKQQESRITLDLLNKQREAQQAIYQLRKQDIEQFTHSEIPTWILRNCFSKAKAPLSQTERSVQHQQAIVDQASAILKEVNDTSSRSESEQTAFNCYIAAKMQLLDFYERQALFSDPADASLMPNIQKQKLIISAASKIVKAYMSIDRALKSFDEASGIVEQSKIQPPNYEIVNEINRRYEAVAKTQEDLMKAYEDDQDPYYRRLVANSARKIAWATEYRNSYLKEILSLEAQSTSANLLKKQTEQQAIIQKLREEGKNDLARRHAVQYAKQNEDNAETLPARLADAQFYYRAFVNTLEKEKRNLLSYRQDAETMDSPETTSFQKFLIRLRYTIYAITNKELRSNYVDPNYNSSNWTHLGYGIYTFLE